VHVMVAVLDTNHFTELVRDSSFGQRLRLKARQVSAFTTIINAQEINEGWCALINRKSAGDLQVKAYAQFLHSLELLMELTLLPFDSASAALFHKLHTTLRHVGTMDLKIAAICVTHDSLLLSRNLLDFEKVPDLRVENWLD
jgi:tRNA(fMet)-specific endonuclease VapC